MVSPGFALLQPLILAVQWDGAHLRPAAFHANDMLTVLVECGGLTGSRELRLSVGPESCQTASRQGTVSRDRLLHHVSRVRSIPRQACVIRRTLRSFGPAAALFLECALVASTFSFQPYLFPLDFETFLEEPRSLPSILRPSSRHKATRSGSSEQRNDTTQTHPPFCVGYRRTTATMPPKKVEKGPAKKVDVKKTVDDKTFGMKNKKGGAAQRQIKQIQAQAKSGGSAEQKKKDAEKAQREREKLAAEAAKREQEALLNKPAQVQKVPFGVDPKTVLCIFHKKGNCEKGKKCKFSHDLELDRKTEKKSLYQDTRQDEDEKKKAETSADWDEDKLRSVVLSKKGNQRTTTDKVCKYFVSAIEDGKYGWFWICPNGGDKCMYKHALPPGYVLIGKPPKCCSSRSC